MLEGRWKVARKGRGGAMGRNEMEEGAIGRNEMEEGESNRENQWWIQGRGMSEGK